MATVGSAKRSAAALAASRVMDIEIDVHVAGGESRFPDGTTFVGADIATDEMVRECHAEGSAVVIVDEHGKSGSAGSVAGYSAGASEPRLARGRRRHPCSGASGSARNAGLASSSCTSRMRRSAKPASQ